MLNLKKHTMLNNKPRTHITLPIALFVVILIAGLMMFRLPEAQAATYNYGEALQKAIYFYECQVSGPKPSWNRVEWRGDSCMNDAVLGGWLDAGDHVKFGLPMAYSASMLGWAAYEYGDGFTNSGQMTYLKNNLKFVLDYFVKCDKGTSLVYQVGDGNTDHSWWGPVECIEKKMTRPSYSCNASCVTGQTAAALAIGYLVLGDATYLTHAKSLFNLADSTRSDATYTAANNFYTSYSGFWDELMWAATWLYLATGDSTYLTKAEGYIPNLKKQANSTEYEYKWTHGWDDCHIGTFLLLARITGNPEYHRFLQLQMDFWTVGYNGEKIKYTPGGLAWLDSWGSLRYATTQAFLAFVYTDFLTDTTLKQRYQSFAISQVNYALGSNPRNGSYEIGFGSNAPKHPHHRTAHGSWCNSQQTPPNHRHILYGALVGGPDSSDGYKDEISNYTTNEVACDYNAGFVGCLAKMYSLNGGTPSSGFPAPETRDDEFFMEALGSSGTGSTDLRINAVNHSGWPARMIKNLSYNYYVDLSEVFAGGYTVSDVKVETFYQEIPVTVSPLTQLAGNIYYVKVTFTDGTDVWPGGDMEHSRELQLRFTAPGWNSANDPSFIGITGTSAKTTRIAMFDGSNLIWGVVPPVVTVNPTPTRQVTATPTMPSTPTPTTVTATPTPTVYVISPPVTATPTQMVTSTPTRRVTPTRARRVTPTRRATPTRRVTPNPTQPVTPTPTYGPTPTPGGPILTRIESSVTSLNLSAPITYGTFSVTLKEDSSGVGISGKTIGWSGAYFYFPDGASSITDSQGVATIRYNIAEQGTGIVNTSLSATFAGASEFAGSTWQIPVTIQMGPTPTRRATPTPTRSVTVTPTSTPVPGGYVVSYVIQSDWGNGATISVTITNKTATAVNGWTLAFTFPGNQTITNLWNGAYTQSGAAVSVKDAGFNASIPANGGSVNFGFNLNYSGTNAKPTDFTLNGTACQVQ